MARKLRPLISIRDARLALPSRRAPHHFVNIATGMRLGYRKLKDSKAAGRWVLEVADGKGGEWQKVVGTADDFEAADNLHVFDFWQAAESARGMARGSASGAPATWAQAIDAYEADLKARGGSPYNAAQVRNHLTAHAPELLAKSVSSLGAAELKRWRNTLLDETSGLKPSSVLRIVKSAQASLNHAANHDPRIQNREAWRVGLGGLHDTYHPINRVQPDAIVHRIMAEADALDSAFGLFVHVAAETGARASQIARLMVTDLQADGLTMPSSRKGSKRTITRRLVPIGRELAARLKRAAGDRAPHEPLLLRPDGATWIDPARKRFLQQPFAIVAERVGIKETMYCLRHSSVVRALLAGVPARLVAANHDTSLAQLERTYSAFVSDAGADVARRGLLAAAGNVVSLKKRRA
jgi:integrase